jgi:hypothetical protein
MFESALEQMFSTDTPNRRGIGHYIDKIWYLGFAVPNDNRRDAQIKHFIQLVNIPQNDSIHIQSFELWPGFFQASGFPIKGARAVMMCAFCYAAKQRPPGRTRRLNQQCDGWDFFCVTPQGKSAEEFSKYCPAAWSWTAVNRAGCGHR